ncbi:TetR/AcrR family transcriptional regulator [Thermophilibacter provencensis]|uniref:TetR/AcrR family transcriptional regulator n=1 Tax=Thermophilibacter provencensis TaxID=1852386 RepID=A0ABT7V149_9ACTN|nr:TetR/AcrR family transcriptional regulator [Thermophilibacter provencensis]MDM8270327.1 TetR/AcrR family transcriptional regulator [Thermophilibacter provencensis]
MTRTVMDPGERRRELLACAMRLFAEEGYDNVSVRAVARAAGVAPGLAYHYFDSKERMFAEAIGDYARRCAEGINAILDEEGPSLDERLDRAVSLAAGHVSFPHEAYFHAEGHGALHDRLSLAMCEAVRPHLRAALEADAAARGELATDADELAAIMTYGAVGLVSGPGMPDGAATAAARRYLRALLVEFRSGGAAD